MQFHYIGQTKDGKKVDMVVSASDRFSLAKDLRDTGILPVLIEEVKDKNDIDIPFLSNIFNNIKLHEKIIFTRNLSGMLTAGLSLYRALTVLEKQTQNKKFKEILHDILIVIDKGGTLSEGMAKYPKVFSTLFVSMVRAGEESGSLANTLTEIGVNLEKTYALNKKIKGALMYPSIILCAIIIIGILMLVFVVPTLTSTFKELNADLPGSTKFVIFISDFMANHALLFVGLLIFIIFCFVYLTRLPKIKIYTDYIVLRLPVVGNIAQELNSARTTRTLSSLLTAGVEMVRSLEITGDVLQNVHYKKIIKDAVTSVQKGETLSSIFKQNTKFYPVMVGEMMEVGEETGKLSGMLIDIATFYEGEVDNKTKDLSTIIEPVLMVFIGGAVGFFAVSMITPMYSLLNNI